MIFTPGPTIAAASGSIGGTVYSHNRYGAYVRNRAIPTNPNTVPQQNARSRLATQSSAWQQLTGAQQLAWKSWANQNPITNALGAQQVLTGQAAFVQLNTRLTQAGDVALTDPPITSAPVGLVTLTGTWDIGVGDFEITYLATPLAANEKMWVRAAVVNSAGIVYVKNLLRVVVITPAAQASPLDTQTDIEAVFGALQVDQRVHIWAAVFDDETGLLSVPLSVAGTVVST